jgi:hypothetical protein
MDCDGLVNIQRSQLPPAEELGGLCGMDLDEVASDGERSRSASPWPEPPPNIMVDYVSCTAEHPRHLSGGRQLDRG